MHEIRPSFMPSPPGYADWLAELKKRIHTTQQRAVLMVNRELILLYWQIGSGILQRQRDQGWGAKVIERLAHDLRTAFPDMKGFSRANLMYMRAFADAWPEEAIVQQPVGQLPWGHNLVLLTKLKQAEQRLAAFVGRQIHLEVGGDDFFIDLLFYHLKLRCYVVIELKAEKFKPEHLGQLGFYLTAVDMQVKGEQDNPTIGLLLCKSKNKVVAEYALRDKAQPIGVAEYQLVASLPDELQIALPSIEQIERELGGDPSHGLHMD